MDRGKASEGMMRPGNALLVIVCLLGASGEAAAQSPTSKSKSKSKLYTNGDLQRRPLVDGPGPSAEMLAVLRA